MKQNMYVINTQIYPIIKNKLNNPNSLKQYKKIIEDYINRRSEELFAIAPYSRIYFGENEVLPIFKLFDVSQNQIKNILSETYYAKETNFVSMLVKDPFTVIMITLIKYFYDKYNDSKGNKKIQEQYNNYIELSMIYLSFSGLFYPYIHYRSFPTVQPSEYTFVMDYVVNNLTNKFDLKREKNIFNTIKSIDKTWFDSYDELFDDFSDDNVVYIVQQLHNRIKSFIINIAKLYYEAYADKDKILTYDSDNLDEDNYHLADNNSLRCARIVENTINYINTNKSDYVLCKRCADENVSPTEVKIIVENITSNINNIPDIKELITCIVSDYFDNNTGKDINDLKFYSYSLKVKPNTHNKLQIRQKELINRWLKEYSARYACSKRPGTISSFYKSILGYFVVLINRANK